MKYLIDGYNLMHALGLAPSTRDRTSLIAARRKMLDWIADRPIATNDKITVVFDAQNARGEVTRETHRDLTIVTARGQLADDYIEEEIATEKHAKQLTIVSNDHRIRDAARLAGCLSLKCREYIDYLLQSPPKSATSKPKSNDKPIRESEEELSEWLKIFGKKK